MAVPTVDLSDDVDVVARRIDEACRGVGFFQIVGHGLDPEIADAATRLAAGFGLGHPTAVQRGFTPNESGPPFPLAGRFGATVGCYSPAPALGNQTPGGRVLGGLPGSDRYPGGRGVAN